jgi:hypothetical protein
MPGDAVMPRATAAPVRGTQTFVGVMGSVWRRPSLTLCEVLWRWSIGAPLLALAAWKMVDAVRNVGLNTTALQAMTVFQPVAATATIHGVAAAFAPSMKPVVVWFLPLSLLWILVASIGRTWVLQNLDAGLHRRTFTLLVLDALRVIVLTLVWSLWIWGVLWAGRVAITGPASRGAEPDLVVYCALLICGTLGLYVVWGAVSWVLQLAPLLAMVRNEGVMASLRETVRSGALRGKLIETNLVMNIVRIALLVLAMVFSACPLPFTNVETATFLVCWWIGVGLLYLVALDYFHVVRAAVYLELWRVCETAKIIPSRLS